MLKYIYPYTLENEGLVSTLPGFLCAFSFLPLINSYLLIHAFKEEKLGHWAWDSLTLTLFMFSSHILLLWPWNFKISHCCYSEVTLKSSHMVYTRSLAEVKLCVSVKGSGEIFHPQLLKITHCIFENAVYVISLWLGEGKIVPQGRSGFFSNLMHLKPVLNKKSQKKKKTWCSPIILSLQELELWLASCGSTEIELLTYPLRNRPC